MAEAVISKNYEGSVCEIKTMDNALISVGKIKEVTSKYVKIANKKKELLIVDYGTKLKVNIFNTNLGFRVLLGNVYTSTKSEISLVSMISLVDRERRNFFRVDMDLEARAVFKKTAMDMYPTEADITILDMSLSGIRFRINSQLDIGKIVNVELDLNKKRLSCFRCKVLRMIDTEVISEYMYGCEFLHKQSEDTDVLCSFLFQKQREFLTSRNDV
ncbi:MAG: PilZ domain-containing protein [Porcipelethomonas sp.]